MSVSVYVHSREAPVITVEGDDTRVDHRMDGDWLVIKKRYRETAAFRCDEVVGYEIHPDPEPEEGSE